jgi:hypothetical protein
MIRARPDAHVCVSAQAEQPGGASGAAGGTRAARLAEQRVAQPVEQQVVRVAQPAARLAEQRVAQPARIARE